MLQRQTYFYNKTQQLQFAIAMKVFLQQNIVIAVCYRGTCLSTVYSTIWVSYARTLQNTKTESEGFYRNIKSILKANKAFKHCVSTLWQKPSKGSLTVTRLAQTQSCQFNVILMYCNQYDFWLYPCIDNQIWFGTSSTPHNYINQQLEKISLSQYQQVVIHSVCVALPTYLPVVCFGSF